MGCVLFWGIYLSLKYVWNLRNSCEETQENERSSDERQEIHGKKDKKLEICKTAKRGETWRTDYNFYSISRGLPFCLKQDKPQLCFARVFDIVPSLYGVDNFKPMANLFNIHHQKRVMNMSIIRQSQYRLQFSDGVRRIDAMVFESVELNISNGRQYSLNMYRLYHIQSSQAGIFLECLERISIVTAIAATEREVANQMMQVMNYTYHRCVMVYEVIQTTASTREVRHAALPLLPQERRNRVIRPKYNPRTIYLPKVTLLSQQDPVLRDQGKQEVHQPKVQNEEQKNEEVCIYEAIGNCSEKRKKKRKPWKIFGKRSKLIKKDTVSKKISAMENEADSSMERHESPKKAKRNRFIRFLSCIILPCRK